jgi:putative chitinase
MTQITPTIIQKITPSARPSTLAVVCPQLNDTMAKYEINTPLRQAHFLAQIIHESGSFNYPEELASGIEYEGRKDLGNTEVGDGSRYKGRGYMQLTGRSNYAVYGKYIGVDLISNPVLVATDYACDVSGWFWSAHALNALADADNGKEITRRINGGFNGLDQRMMFLAKAKQALGA